MFRFGTQSFAACGSRLGEMCDRLPQAHRAASEAASAQVLGSVHQAATGAGWAPEDALGVSWVNGAHHLTVAPGAAGDRLFDHEFGTPEEPPRPVLRQAAKTALKRAQPTYVRRLVGEMFK